MSTSTNVYNRCDWLLWQLDCFDSLTALTDWLPWQLEFLDSLTDLKASLPWQLDWLDSLTDLYNIRPCGQLVGLCPTCLFYSLRHGHLGVIEVFPLIIKVFPLITKVIPFSHQSLPFGNQGPRFNSSIYILLKWSVTKNLRTYRLTDRMELRTISVISIDDIFHCLFVLFKVSKLIFSPF